MIRAKNIEELKKFFMKMENILRAEKDAKVKSVLVAAGDKLAVDDVMIEFE